MAVTAAAVRHARRARGISGAVALAGVGVTARLGVVGMLPGKVQVRRGKGDVIAHLSSALGRPVEVGLLVGPVRATQKPVLQVFSGEGELLGYAKVGLNAATRALVVHEGKTLEALAKRDLVPLRLPRVLYRGRFRGHEVLVQEAFGGIRAKTAPDLALLAAMTTLARSGGVTKIVLKQSPFWQRTTENLQGVAAEVAQGLPGAEKPMSFGAWHGDWAPWNMTWAGGRCQVWDWEGFRPGVPLGFDLVHYELQKAVVIGGVHPVEAVPAVAAKVTARLGAFGLDRDEAALVPLLYLLNLIAEFTVTGESTSRLARLETWVPQTLPDLACPK